MVKYGESYITTISGSQVIAKAKYKATITPYASSKLRTFAYVNASFIISDATNLTSTATILVDAIKYRKIRTADCIMIAYSNIAAQSKNKRRLGTTYPLMSRCAMSVPSSLSIQEFYANIFPMAKMGTNYIEGHVIRFEITDGFVFDPVNKIYSRAKTFGTFKVPYATKSYMSSSTTYYAQPYDFTKANADMSSSTQFELPAPEPRITRNVPADLEQTVSVFARGVINPGSLASLLFPYSFMDSPFMRFRSTLVQHNAFTNYNQSGQRIRYFQLDSSTTTTWKPCGGFLRKTGSTIFSESEVYAPPYNFTKASAGIQSSFTHSNGNDTRLRRTPVSLTSTTAHNNGDDTRLRRTTVSMTSTSSMTANGDFGGFTIDFNVTYNYSSFIGHVSISASVGSIIDWGDGTSTTITIRDFNSGPDLSYGHAQKQYTTIGTKTVIVKNMSDFAGANIYYNTPGTTLPNAGGYKIVSWGTKPGKDQGYNSIRKFVPAYFSFQTPGDPSIDNLGEHTCTGVPSNLPLRDNSNSTQRMQLISLGSSVSGGYGSASLFNDPNITTWDLNRLPTLAQSTTPVMRYMFTGCTSFNQNINSWDTTKITNMDYWFRRATSFNQSLNSWNTSNVTSMRDMFYNATIFNGDISSWNTANVTNMSYMFNEATAFNQNIGNWNVANVTNMTFMFYNARAFDQNIGNWNTQLVGNMSFMLSNARAFNQYIGSWNTTNVNNMSGMFASAIAFNQSLNNWNTSSVTNMSFMFYMPDSGPAAFNGDIGNWNTGSVTNMDSMFRNARAFNQPIGSWNTSSVTNMNDMFSNAIVFNQDISTWNTGNVTDMSGMFGLCTAFNQPLNTWNTGKVTNMGSMFAQARAFNQPLNTWNTGNVTDMSGMFAYARAFNQPIGDWDTSKVTNMDRMFINFQATPGSFDQDISGWCVTLIPTKPTNFDTYTPATWTTAEKPVWGTCPP